MPGLAFFICGTPSNNRGFEFVALGPEQLPGSPETYLDKPPSDAIESHRIEEIQIAGRRYVACSRVLRINPNDAEANRGAYIAVGVLLGQRLAFHTIANCLDVVSEIYGGLCSSLTADRSFPVGFRLANLGLVGTPLEERVEYRFSPLLLADAVLQALNGEGPIDWSQNKQLLLAPGELTAADVSRYQFYSRQGSLGSVASIDDERARLQEAAQRTATATRLLLELQHEWATLQQHMQAAAGRVSEKRQALQQLAEDVERRVNRDLTVDDQPTAGRETEDEQARLALDDAGRSPYRPAYMREGAGNAAAQRTASALIRSSTVRRRHGQRRSAPPRSRRLVRAMFLTLLGGALAIAAVLGIQKLLLPELEVDAVSSPAVVAEPEPRASEESAEPPESDVARERAALDALPDE
jgi:hypothetical protein